MSNFNTSVGDAKDTTGKLPMHLIDPEVYIIYASVAQVGYEKYGAENQGSYKNGIIDDYFGAMLRHYVKHIGGEEFDPETGLPHLYHMSWNAMVATMLYMSNTKSNTNNPVADVLANCMGTVDTDNYDSVVNAIAEKVRLGSSITAEEASVLLFNGGWSNNGSRE